jgi:hypothetical protein
MLHVEAVILTIAPEHRLSTIRTFVPMGMFRQRTTRAAPLPILRSAFTRDKASISRRVPPNKRWAGALVVTVARVRCTAEE